MDNLIMLYKVPFVYGDIKQPYFCSSSDRDAYFAKMPSLQVNKEGVNINVAANYAIDFKANIDITVAQQYNFAVIRYNGKNYYANIIDCAHISVNRSRIFTQRNPMFEVIDPFSYFYNFNVLETNGRFLSYSHNTYRTLPTNIRFYSKKLDIYEPNIWDNSNVNPDKRLQAKSYNVGGNSYTITPDFEMVPFYSAYVKAQALDYAAVDLYGQVSQQFLYLVPLNTQPRYFRYRQPNGGWVTSSGAKQATHNKVIVTLNSFSAYISSLQVVWLPCKKYTVDGADRYLDMPYLINDFISQSDGIGYFRVAAMRYNQQQMLDGLTFSYNESFSQGYSTNWKRVIQSMDCYLFSKNLTHHIDYSDYCSEEEQRVGFDIDYEFIASDKGWSILVSIESKYLDSKIPKGVVKRELFPLTDNTSYIVTAEEQFNAENRYYDELTNSYRNQKIVDHSIQAAENVAVGAAQMGFGLHSTGLGPGAPAYALNESAGSLGTANIIRGVSEVGQIWADDHFISQQRELNKLNEQSKPAAYFAASNSQSFWTEQNAEFWFFENVPFEEDAEAYFNHLRIYGEEVVLFLPQLSAQYMKDNSVDGYFFLKATAQVSSATLQARDFTELYRYLTAGHRYQVIGTPNSDDTIIS